MKELVESLRDDKITRKVYKENIDKIADKVNEIWRFICKVSDRDLDWWAFRNDVSYGRGNGSSGGEFDPVADADFIEITGECTYINCAFYEYNEGFPTRFLWENYKLEVKNHVAAMKKMIIAEKKKNLKNKLSKHKKKKDLKVKLKKLLTPDELKMVVIK